MRSALASRLFFSAIAVVGAVGAAGCSSKGSSGIGGIPCDSPSDCPSGKVCAGGTCADPGNGRPGTPCSATRDCAGGTFCEGVTGVCTMGGGLDTGATCTSDRQCRPPLRCNMTSFYGACAEGGDIDMGGTCHATNDCLSGLYCGANNQCGTLKTAYPPFAGATCADEGAFRGYFEIPRPGKPPADFFRLPFPNDARVTAGALDISDFPKPGPTPLGVDLVKLYVDTWTADFDGFSAAAAITFRFSDNIDYASATGEVVKLIDVTAGPTFGYEYSRSWVSNNGRTKYSCNHTIAVRNTADAPFEPGHTYAAYVTTGLTSDKGTPAAPDGDFATVMGATRPSDPSLGHAWDAYMPLRSWMASKGTDAPALAAAAVFTVQDAPGHMKRLAAAVATQPMPALTSLTLCGPGVTSPCDDGTPARACPAAADPTFDEIHGRFSVPIYQAGSAPYETPADGGGISEAGGMPTLVRTDTVCFALTIPKGAAAPATGWPLVVYHHGTGGSMRSLISEGIAKQLATMTRPAAGFSFDAVEHGARKGTSTKKPDDLVFNPLNPRAARDNFLQGAVDILQALRVAGTAIPATSSPTSAAITFDPDKLTFFGHSQGSTSGEMAIAQTAAVRAAVFSGAGAYLTSSLLDKTMPVNISTGMEFLIGEPLDHEHPVMTLFQSFYDRSDPLNANPLIIVNPPAALPSKHVYMSWGKGDTYTPRSTLEANALSLGIAPVGTVIEDFGTPAIVRPVTANQVGGDSVPRTAGVFQYAPGSYDGHFVATMNNAAIADWTAFLQSYFATGTPAIP
jgi:predicted esterase